MLIIPVLISMVMIADTNGVNCTGANPTADESTGADSTGYDSTFCNSAPSKYMVQELPIQEGGMTKARRTLSKVCLVPSFQP